MARKSRKTVVDEIWKSDPEPTYRVALYMRLSDKDREHGVSNSIQNQKELLLEFIRDKPDLSLVSIFCDDGKTGTNFSRSGFEQMIEAARIGEVNCIIVKDLSRFGRNYLETGNYIENIFPFLNIRFIAVTDNFDTLTATASQLAWLIPLKNVMNENYARDISKKERSSKKILRKQGCFIGAYGVYGYERSRDNKHRLVIDEAAAVHVREIYNMYEDGYGDAAIAKYLNQNHVASPARYKYEKGILHNDKYAHTSGWYPQRVAAILTNRVYIGDMVQGVQTNVGMKGKKVVSPQKDWDIVTGTHDSIISKEQFEVVQQIRNSKRKYFGNAGVASEPGLLRGKIFCGDCDRAMVRKRIKGCRDQYRYICETYGRNGMCGRKYFREEDLLETVREVIQKRIAVSTDIVPWIITQERITEQKLQKWNQELNVLKKRQEHLIHKKSVLYGDCKEGILDKYEYNFMKTYYSKEIDALNEEAMNLQKLKQEYILYNTTENLALRVAYQIKENFVLSQQIADGFLEKIEVFEGNRVKVTLCYQDEFIQSFEYWKNYNTKGEE